MSVLRTRVAPGESRLQGALVILAVFLAACAALVTSPPFAAQLHAAGAPKPGTIIDAKNAKLYAQFITPALMKAIGHGLKIRVTPTERLDWSEGYRDATEKYSPQVRLDKHGWLKNYVAGMPFPTFKNSDPRAALKIAYDWAYGPFTRDDNRIIGYREAAYAFKPGDPAHFWRDKSYDHWAREVDFLRYAHRSQVDPRPTLGANPQAIEFAIRAQDWNDPSHTTCLPPADPLPNVQSIVIRYQDPTAPDLDYVRAPGAGLDPRDLSEWVFARYCRYVYFQPKIEFAHYKLVGVRSILGSVDDSSDAGLDREGGRFAIVPFQIRRAYVLRMIPIEQSPPAVAQIYLDTETFLELASDGSVYGHTALYTFPLWKRLPAKGGGGIYEIIGGFGQPGLKGLAAAADAYRTANPELFNYKTASRGPLPHFWWFRYKKQEINTGKMSEGLFNPMGLE